MRKLLVGITLFSVFFAVSMAKAASGYSVVIDSPDYGKIGILIYFDDSASDIVPGAQQFINVYLPMLLEDEEVQVTSQALSASELIQEANEVITKGASFYEWDTCIAIVVSENSIQLLGEQIITLNLDIFLLGLEQDEQIIPYEYVGSIQLNKDLLMEFASP